MKILVVGGGDALLSFLTEELESRGFEMVPTHFGDGGLSLYKKDGPFAFVLADHCFFPGAKVKDCTQLVTAIDGVNPFQPMAIMTADPKEAREKLTEALRNLSVLRKPFRIEKVLRLLRQPCCRFEPNAES